MHVISSSSSAVPRTIKQQGINHSDSKNKQFRDRNTNDLRQKLFYVGLDSLTETERGKGKGTEKGNEKGKEKEREKRRKKKREQENRLRLRIPAHEERTRLDEAQQRSQNISSRNSQFHGSSESHGSWHTY